ncbi:Prophage PSPPH06, putative tail tube protein [Moritella viscosa]|uniref:phage protein n=1 Tax=Moritella viscosa TaxID=80854 RepID=UPI000912E6C1|nr:phage protein [Moritella viscosa]SGY86797.1 Prophage PSPPH06, putative tail tube protein [Moritella viscosa]
MSVKALGGKDFDIFIGDKMVHVIEASVKITDGRKAKKVRGITKGYIDGPVDAEVTIKLDHENFLILQDVAKTVGSWKGIEPFDISFLAEVAAGTKNIEAFGVLPQLDEILNIKAEGGEEDTTTIKGPVTSTDFIKINGIPYLTAEEVRDL